MYLLEFDTLQSQILIPLHYRGKHWLPLCVFIAEYDPAHVHKYELLTKS